MENKEENIISKRNDTPANKGPGRQVLFTVALVVFLVMLVATLNFMGWLSIAGVKESYGSIGNFQPQEITVKQAVSLCDQVPAEIVKISGTIITECRMGTWFRILDEDEELFVDLKPANLIVPERIGKKATVYGTLKRRGLRCYLECVQVDF